MAINRYASAHLSTKQIIHRHIGHFPFNIPQRHINAGNCIVYNRPAAPIRVLVHQLPKLSNIANIASNHQRGQIGFNQMLYRKVAIGECRAAQAIQFRFAGFYLYNDQIDAFRRRADHLDVANHNSHTSAPFSYTINVFLTVRVRNSR